MTPRPAGRVHLAALAAMLAGARLCAQTPEVNLFGAEPARLQQGGNRNPIAGFIGWALGGNKVRGSNPRPMEYLPHAITFQDGRRLRGELLSLDKEQIVWKRTDASEPLRFSRKLIRQIALGPDTGQGVVHHEMSGDAGTGKKVAAKHATVKLPGADWLYAEVTSPDGETFQLSMGGESKFTVPRSAIEWMHFGMVPAPAASLAPGTMALESWVRPTPTGTVEEKDGWLSVKGVDWIGKNVSPPARFEMSFDLKADDKATTTLWIQPFGPQPNCYGTGTIELDFSQGSINRCIYINNMNHEKSAMPKDAGPDGRARFRVFYDGVDGKLLVYRNGKEVGNWKTREEKEEKQRNGWPRGISGICLQREGGPEVGHFRMLPWDGVVPVEGAPVRVEDSYTAGKEAPVIGKLESIGDKELVFSGEKKTRETGVFLQLHSQPKAIAGADALLVFAHRGELGAAGLEIDGSRAKFRTSFADQIDVPASALNVVSFPTSTVEIAPGAALVFKNGDELPGSLIHAQNGATVKWKTEAGQEVEFQAARVAGVRMTSAEEAKPTPSAVLEMSNGDRLRGELSALDAKRVQLKHALLGTLDVTRERLTLVYPNPKTTILDASSEPAVWLGEKKDEKKDGKKASPKRLVHLDGRFVMANAQNYSTFSSDGRAGGLNRQLAGLPDKFEVRCDAVDMSGNEPNLSIRLSSTGKETSSLDLDFNYGSLRVYGWSSGGRSRSFWKDVQLRNQRGGYEPIPRLSVRLFVDNKVGTVDVLVNGEHKVKSGQAVGERVPGVGQWVTIGAYGGSNVPAVVSDVWVGPWNGELPRPSLAACVSLSNGDIAEAAPSEMKDGKLLVDLGGGPMEVPIDRVDAIHFDTQPSTTGSAGRIRLVNGDAISVESFKFDGGELVARSTSLGELRIPSAKLREIAFDVPAPRFPLVPKDKKKTAANVEPQMQAPVDAVPAIPLPLVPAQP